MRYTVEELLHETAYEVARRRGVGHATLLARYEELRELAVSLLAAREEFAAEAGYTEE